MSPNSSASASYPAVRFVLRHGHRLAIAVGAAVTAGGIAAALDGMGWGWAALGVLGGPFAYLILKSYAELVTIIAEMLLPR